MSEFTKNELELAFNSGKFGNFNDFIKVLLENRTKTVGNLKKSMLSKLKINEVEFKKQIQKNKNVSIDPFIKQITFEYILKKCLDWYKELNPNKENNIGALKSLKLLFFISAARANSENKSCIIDKVFDNFYAMPYGHIEIDIQNLIKKSNGDLKYFTIDNLKAIEKENISELFSDKRLLNIKDEVDLSISKLREMNDSIINYNTFELVELNHCFYSWKKNYNISRDKGEFSKKVPNNDIKRECKIFKNYIF